MPTTSDKTSVAAFTPKQIYVAAFLGSPISAAWFIRKNFLVAGDLQRASTTIWRGLALTLLVLVIAYLLPERTPRIGLPIGYSVLIYFYALSLFDKPVKQHLESGGAKGSWWEVIGVSVAVAALMFGLLFGLFYALSFIGLPPMDSSDA